MKFYKVVIVVIFLMSFLLVGCQNNTNETLNEANLNQGSEENNLEVENQDVTEAVEANTLSSLDVAYLMGNGTNLGNTMEAYGRTEVGLTADVSAYETIWGQPVTTKAMIEGMKASGFDTLRIPVAWTNTMDYENGDYTISQDYMDRVQTIVDYALDANMYVIINDHWDGGWWGMFGSETEETQNKAHALYEAMWTQIATNFKDYPYQLIFESANEELGNRLNDRDVARDSGTLSEDECYTLTNTINQNFVDLIRSTGSYNSERFLLIAGYNTDIEMTVDDRFEMPNDPADKLLLSVHYYTPWSYCGTTGMATWGSEKNYTTMNDLFKQLSKFTDQGYGVVIGEYAVLTKADGSLKNNTYEFTNNLLDNCDLYGYVPLLWDTNAFFKKDALKIVDETLGQLYLNRSYQAQSDLSKEDVVNQAKSNMAAALELAIENDALTTGPVLDGSEQAVAWLMFNSLDYSVTYSVGDAYDPTLKTEGVTAADLVIEGPGTYTVGLDFTNTYLGYADSTVFSALGLSNGELLFPDYIINIKEIKINDEVYAMKGVPYTTSDDEVCTRVNLYNGWVSDIDLKTARFTNPNVANFLSAKLIDPNEVNEIKTIYVTFEYGPK